jgi:short-subunit dehydrogenase
VAAYSAAKFALAGWSESLFHEERRHGVHVGLVLPGFIATEGFPQSDLRAKRLTRWMVSTPEHAAQAIMTAVDGKPEVSVPRWYGLLVRLRYAAPGIVRLILSGPR